MAQPQRPQIGFMFHEIPSKQLISSAAYRENTQKGPPAPARDAASLTTVRRGHSWLLRFTLAG